MAVFAKIEKGYGTLSAEGASYSDGKLVIEPTDEGSAVYLNPGRFGPIEVRRDVFGRPKVDGVSMLGPDHNHAVHLGSAVVVFSLDAETGL